MKKLFILLFIPLFFFPVWDLFQPGLPQGHDTQDHVARIANFYQNLSEGTVIPRWAGNLNWGYGHPILMFLYPLPSYMTSLIHFFGFSFVDSVKIFFGLAFIASGLTMYLWLKQFLSREAAFVGAALYMFAPYRFVDLYVRGAIGEHAAFVFPPLVLYFLYKLFHSSLGGSRSRSSYREEVTSNVKHEQRKTLNETGVVTDRRSTSYWYLLGGSLSLAGLILAHNAISLMFLPIILLYAGYLVWQSKRKKLLIAYCSLLIALGFALSAFFWMPAFMEGKYTLRDKVTEGSVMDRFSSPMQLLYGPWSYGGTGQLSVQVGLIQWLFVVISIPLVIVEWLKNKKRPVFLLFSLLFFFFTLFLITPYSQMIWETISTLQKFQFPWRFLSLSAFLAAVIGAIVFSAIFPRHSGGVQNLSKEQRVNLRDSEQARMTKLRHREGEGHDPLPFARQAGSRHAHPRTDAVAGEDGPAKPPVPAERGDGHDPHR
jgi:hypothetical protein